MNGVPLKQDNEALFLKHAAKWRRRCVFQDKDGHMQSYLERSPPGEPFGVGCTLCSRFAKHHPSLAISSPFVSFSKGSGPCKLQLEDLLRHGNMSKKEKFHCKIHQQALQWHLTGAVVKQPKGDGDPDVVGITPAQALLCVETVHAPHGAQGTEYQRKCTAVNRRSGAGMKAFVSKPDKVDVFPGYIIFDGWTWHLLGIATP